MISIFPSLLMVIFLSIFKDFGASAAADCSDLYGEGVTTDGVHSITLQSGSSIQVYCEFKGGAGWTRFQRREDGSQNFYRNWNDYKQGFGSATGEHWLGNDNIHALTSQKSYTLRVDMELTNGTTYYAEYSQFSINNEADNYRMLVSGYSGDAGDSLTPQPTSSNQTHNNMQFSTSDRDNDQSPVHCSQTYNGGWWYDHCYASNLNGGYWTGGNCPQTNTDKCIQWYFTIGYDQPYKKITMLVKGPSSGGTTTTVAPVTTPPIITEPPTGTPGSTSTPPVLGLTDPTVDIRLDGTFRSTNNEVFPIECIDAYNSQLQIKARSIVNDVNAGIATICSQTSGVTLYYAGTQVSAVGSEARVTFTFTVVGSKDITVRSLETCTNSIISHLQQHSNWQQPLISDVVGCPSVTFDNNYFNPIYMGWVCSSRANCPSK